MGSSTDSRKEGPVKPSHGRSASDKPVRMNVSRTHRPEGLGLEQWQQLLRKQYGEQQDFHLENRGNHPIFSEFILTNPHSQKNYRIAIRGNKPGDNYCSCPDFRINGLGTCKHIAFTLRKLMTVRGATRMFAKGYVPPFSEVFLTYGVQKEVRFRAGVGSPPELISLAREFFDEHGVLRKNHLLDFPQFLSRITRNNGHEVRCYDDVMAFIAEHQDREHRQQIIKEHLGQGIESPTMKSILKTDLYPYQREGALFAGRGRTLSHR